jgi:protein-S-isoprenylcysteine O-methyltransferase Ste14
LIREELPVDTARYIVTITLAVSMPPAVLLWFAIHPFTRFWRRLGLWWTYSILSIPTFLLMAWVIVERDRIMAVDYGTSYWTIALAGVAVAVGGAIAFKRKKYLTFAILSGAPQLSQKRYPGVLLKEGIYGTIRHPRYVEVTLFVLAYALFGNYLAGYVISLGTVVSLYLVVLMEERELLERFGQEYEEYSKRVPRFIPRHS